MPTLMKPSVFFLLFCFLAAGGLPAQSEPGKAKEITPEYLHGDWCQRYYPPPEEDLEASLYEQRHNLTFRPDGVFLIGRVGSPLREIGKWSLEDGRLRMSGNPVAGRPYPTWVSDNEFHFGFMGIDVEVHRGHCKRF